MKTNLLSILFLFSTMTVLGSYRPLKIYELAVGAEEIVYGEITEIDSLTYTLRIEGSLTDNYKEIKVLKFQDWPCAWRWTDYKVGQKLFLFLKMYNGEQEKFQGNYYSMSAGNEGELPLFNDSVFINATSLNSPPAYWPDSLRTSLTETNDFVPSVKHKIYGAEYYGYKMDLLDFISTVQTIRNCFEISYKYVNDIDEVITTCSGKNLESANETNKILKWSIKELKRKTGGNNK
jgi:hypothetical protein